MRHLLASFCLSLLAATLGAQSSVRLVKVPEVLRLPAVAGSNLLLEVECDGAPGAVWLATDHAATDRVPLAAAGAARWQLNLADPRVGALLPSGRDDGSLVVFATIGGKTQASTALFWVRATHGDGKVRCLLRTRAGASVSVDNGAFAWFDAAAVERLELHGAAARQSAVVARLGDLQLPLQRRGDTDLWVLASDDTLRERLDGVDAFEVEAKLGGTSAMFRFAVVPRRLQIGDDASGEGKVFAVTQRQRAAVPGSNGWFTVHVGDITRGSALLHVTSADGRTVVGEELLHARDFVELPLAAERYVLVVDAWKNHLVGDDRAELRVRPAKGFQPDRVAQLIRAVNASTDTFSFGDHTMPSSFYKQWLVGLVTSRKAGYPTVEQFLALVADHPDDVDKRTVRRGDGTTVSLYEWLRAALREIEAREAAQAAKAIEPAPKK